jgi:hypothetical protein
MIEDATVRQSRLVKLTDEGINEMSRDLLRLTANDLLADYHLRETVFSVKLTETVLTTPGALTAIDDIVQTLWKVYGNDGPKMEATYSVVEISVWKSNDSLRQSLRYNASRARKELEQEQGCE